jgi:hypothetical protein
MSSGEVLGSAGTVMPDASGLELDQVTVVLLFEGAPLRGVHTR